MKQRRTSQDPSQGWHFEVPTVGKRSFGSDRIAPADSKLSGTYHALRSSHSVETSHAEFVVGRKGTESDETSAEKVFITQDGKIIGSQG
jgi:hypothetical protein